MNKIVTNSVVDPSIQQPFTTKSLDFLQSKDIVFADSIARNIAPYDYDLGLPIVLSGCERTVGAPNTYFNGFIYWDHEIYAFDGGNVTITTTDSFRVVITNDATADPLTFTDGIARNVHNIRKLEVVDTSVGGTLFDYSSLVFCAKWKKTNTTSAVITSTVAATLATVSPSQKGSNVTVTFSTHGQTTGTGTSTFLLKKGATTVKTVTVTNSNSNEMWSFSHIDTGFLDSDTFSVTMTQSTGSGNLSSVLIVEN
jgi:hypothetical protein